MLILRLLVFFHIMGDVLEKEIFRFFRDHIRKFEHKFYKSQIQDKLVLLRDAIETFNKFKIYYENSRNIKYSLFE